MQPWKMSPTPRMKNFSDFPLRPSPSDWDWNIGYNQPVKLHVSEKEPVA
jgi:hypothetical protein